MNSRPGRMIRAVLVPPQDCLPALPPLLCEPALGLLLADLLFLLIILALADLLRIVGAVVALAIRGAGGGRCASRRRCRPRACSIRRPT